MEDLTDLFQIDGLGIENSLPILADKTLSFNFYLKRLFGINRAI
ncbi:hypothetical protein [Caldisericum exile]|uniref:Uncharacterized protein n=1 Tax=Caldisericum exile (strain DSM 21853 / NBRC 104410 / AZM16c01) TaxID=511051 RepID=A0A7U6GE64_CALEA|nr:hypothetical protein [Caldisericum exile]BAL80667.1 hypothetical protein CSE_05410 [Caldisericum exile AZM16c01]